MKAQYVAVREQSREKHQHYHVALILDGQKTQSIHNHIRTAERLWDLTLGLPEKENGYGLIDDCTTSRTGEKQVNGVMLRYDDPWRPDKKDDCFRRASYLAKTNTISLEAVHYSDNRLLSQPAYAVRVTNRIPPFRRSVRKQSVFFPSISIW